MEEVLVDGGQFVGELCVEQTDDFFIALHDGFLNVVLKRGSRRWRRRRSGPRCCRAADLPAMQA
jgi:hypothetical protein